METDFCLAREYIPMVRETFLISISKGMFQIVVTPHYPFAVVAGTPHIPGDGVFEANGV
jgi:hypothetical protein